MGIETVDGNLSVNSVISVIRSLMGIETKKSDMICVNFGVIRSLMGIETLYWEIGLFGLNTVIRSLMGIETQEDCSLMRSPGSG